MHAESWTSLAHSDLVSPVQIVTRGNIFYLQINCFVRFKKLVQAAAMRHSAGLRLEGEVGILLSLFCLR